MPYRSPTYGKDALNRATNINQGSICPRNAYQVYTIHHEWGSVSTACGMLKPHTTTYQAQDTASLVLELEAPNTTVHVVPPPGAVFQARFARQPRGRQYRTVRLRKALGEMPPTSTVLRTDTIPTISSYCGHIEHGKIGPRACDRHRRILEI